MNTLTDRPAIQWDRRQWASGGTAIPPAETGPRWSLWQWAGQRPSDRDLLGLGDSALSGFGRNPGGQHWAEASPRPGRKRHGRPPEPAGATGAR